MADSPLWPSDPAIEAAVRQQTVAWLEKAVIGLNLCPFARVPVQQGLVRYTVTAASSADQLLSELEQQALALSRLDARQLETVLLIHPACMADFIDFHFFLAEADALLRRLDLEGILQIASFHPDYQFASVAKDDLSNFTNRSPYPILHLLREESVTRATRSLPNASSVTDRNIATLQRLGRSGWDELWVKH